MEECWSKGALPKPSIMLQPLFSSEHLGGAVEPLGDEKLGGGELVFVLDWDDTLCASTEHQRYSGDLATDPNKRFQWRNLAMWVKVMLHHMLMYAPNAVYVVTNSQTGWVEDRKSVV